MHGQLETYIARPSQFLLFEIIGVDEKSRPQCYLSSILEQRYL